jgi:hypothetical protein
MKRILQIIAIVVAVDAVAFWLLLGANRGWTKTSREVKTLDEVTGIEGITYEKKFSPGLDFLALGLLGAGVLTGVSLIVRSKSPTTNRKPPTPLK